MKNKVRMLNQ
jgi:hypothetical protein